MMKSIEVTNFTGKIGCVGLYLPSDPGGENDQARAGVYPLPLGQFFFRGLSLGAGRANVKKYNPYPRDLTVAGRPIPSQIVPHELPLEGAQDACENFDKRADSYAKVLLKPAEGRIANVS